MHLAEDDKEKARLQGMIDILIPVCKGYVTDRAYDVCNLGVQVYGGYGYIREYPQEQLVRDCRITMIYEGTNGIQAMDLLGRKLGMDKGAVFMDLLNEITAAIKKAAKIPRLEKSAAAVEKSLNRLGEIAMHLGKTAVSKDLKLAFAYAHPFLEVVGDVIMAWMLLWRAAAAVPKLEKLAGSADENAIRSKVAQNKDAAFYDGQLKTAEFFIHCMLPATMGKMNAIAAGNPARVVKHLAPEESFTTREQWFSRASNLFDEIDQLDRQLLGDNTLLHWLRYVFFPSKGD
jgi:hypothetical protein